MNPWEDTSLILYAVDEEFRDCTGYWGYYSVSNYGRIKSESRGGSRKERILKQCIPSSTQTPSLCFSVDTVRRSRGVSQIVADESLRKAEPYECVAHLNKVKYDNRVSNLKIMTYSKSCKLDYLLGKKTNWGMDQWMRTWVKDHDGKVILWSEYNKKYLTIVDGKTVAVVCNTCHKKQTIDRYYLHDKKTKTYKPKCKTCCDIRDGVKEIGKIREGMKLAEKGFRKCWTCRIIKPFSQFCRNRRMYKGLSYVCRDCTKIYNAISNPKRYAKIKKEKLK